MPKGVYPHTHIVPKVYPPEMVNQVRELYSAGHTQGEIALRLGTSQKTIWRLMRNHGLMTRGWGKREQRGEKNATWRGDAAGYDALHVRVEVARGKPQHCAVCDTRQPGRYEWANLTGHYEDIDDYMRMCVSCHRIFDAARRKVTGMPTSPEGGGGAACPQT